MGNNCGGWVGGGEGSKVSECGWVGGGEGSKVSECGWVGEW